MFGLRLGSPYLAGACWALNNPGTEFDVVHCTKFLDTIPAKLGQLQSLLKNSYIFLYFELEGLRKDLFLIAHEKLQKLIGHLQVRTLANTIHSKQREIAKIQSLLVVVGRNA